MFAPYCTTCGVRQLLGHSRLVASAWERGGTIYLRCWCGTLLDAQAQPPPAPHVHAGDSNGVGRSQHAAAS